jgi:glycine/D-amino acid oxidase-like deaminating enzyme
MKRHVVVIGAGAFGGWTALMLLRAGFRVTLVDAWGAGNSRASSGGETRIIRAVYGGVADYSHMAARALTLWREAERQWPRQVFVPSGALWLFNADDAYVRSSIPHIEAAGLSVEELDPAEAARRYPQMNFRDVRTAFLEPDAGFLAARAACELVRSTFVREGGEYLESWTQPGTVTGDHMDAVDLAGRGALRADQFVFACGAWMGEVFPDVIGRRIVATRQEVFFFGAPAGDTRYDASALPAWVHIGERFVYGLPSHEGRGVKIADDSPGEEMNPTTTERSPSADGLERARAGLRQRFPALGDAPLLESRVCQYEASSDRHFLIDKHPGLTNVWLVGGGSGHGFKMGPALGEHVAALVQVRAEVNPLFAYGRLTPSLRD